MLMHADGKTMDRKLSYCRDQLYQPGGNGASADDDPSMTAMRERLKSECKKRIQEKRMALFKDMRTQKRTPEEVVQKICNETEQQQQPSASFGTGNDVTTNSESMDSSAHSAAMISSSSTKDSELLKELEEYLYEVMHNIEQEQLELYDSAMDHYAAELAEVEENETTAHELAFLNDIDSGGNPTYNRSSVPSSSHSNVVKQSEVLCPVCKKRWLYQRGAIIICRCGFSLDTLNGITIEHLQTQLAESFQEHVDTGCTGSLEYEVLNLTSDTPDSDEANVSMDRQCQNLLATCSQCDYMSVVI